MKQLITAITAAVISASSFADTGTLTFRGSVNDQCSLTGYVDGTIVVNAAGNAFSSADAGGAPATVSAVTNAGSFRLVFGQPMLTGTNGMVSNVTFNIASSATGVNSGGQATTPVSSMGSVLALTQRGAYNVVVNASAVLSGNETFPSGTYTLQIPVSCTK